VDAVVNAANSALAGGGGVDGAIHRAAGAAELHAACTALGRCDPGDAKATPGFRLAGRAESFHTVGPVWGGGTKASPRSSPPATRRCLALGRPTGSPLGGLPAISTGVYGYPPALAAEVAVSTVTAVHSCKGTGTVDPTTELRSRVHGHPGGPGGASRSALGEVCEDLAPHE